MSRALESLILFKRHSADCPVHKSRIPKKKREFWFECECPIWIRGTTPAGDFYPRQTTGHRELRQAEAMRDALLTQGKRTDAGNFPVAECIEKYLALREHDLDERTLGQHKLALERLARYLERKGVLYIHQLKADHLESFKTEGLPKKMASTTRATTDAKIRCFLRMAYRREWTTEVLVEKVKPVRAVYEQKEPYTDDEVTTILEHAGKLNGGTHGYAAHPATFRLLLELMLSTGMRVGDAVSFDPRKLEVGESLWVYTYVPRKQKRTDRPKAVEAYITADLKSRINGCDWLSQQLPFWYGSGSDPDALAQAVYERMQSIGERAGVADCRPHRLRDTFAVRRLLSGMQLEDVSRLLGHSSVKVTEAYYAKWVSSRKRRLERLVTQSLMNS
jgi:site-specific recombinase XerD